MVTVMAAIDRVNRFFIEKRNTILQNCSRADSEFLRQWQVLNYLAVLKACKKHDKHFTDNPVKESVLKVLMQQAFVKDLSHAPLFANESFQMDCAICYCKMVSPFTLKCKHTFCYVCLKDCYMNGHAKCPLCRSNQNLNPVNQTIDLILGVVATKYYPDLIQDASDQKLLQSQPGPKPKPATKKKPRKAKYRIKDQERRRKITTALQKLAKLALTEETDRSVIIRTAAKRILTLEAEKEQLTSYLVSNSTMLTTISNLRVCSWVVSMSGKIMQVSQPMLDLCEMSSQHVLNRNINSCWSSRFLTLETILVDFQQIVHAIQSGIVRTLKVLHCFMSGRGVMRNHLVCFSPFVEPITQEMLLFVAGMPVAPSVCAPLAAPIPTASISTASIPISSTPAIKAMKMTAGPSPTIMPVSTATSVTFPAVFDHEIGQIDRQMGQQIDR